MTYELACQLICSVNDRDQDAVDAVFRGATRADVQSLAIMLAAMVPEDSHTPHSVIKARTAHIECTAGTAGAGTAAFDYAADITANLFGVRITDLFSVSRKARETEARQVLCWVARHALDMPFAEIGRRVGRDHSTVMAGCKRVSDTSSLRTKAAIVTAAIGADTAAVPA